MNKLVLVAICLLFSSGVNTLHNGSFPSDFLFGVGTSAYQTEGGWNEGGKGENIWDHWIHENASHIANNDTADVACNSYHWYELDILSAKGLNVAHYQFSISWSRILPNGDDLNTRGILYYKAVIAKIIESGMIPVATLYHYDLPQALQDIGGWTNPEMVGYFVKYARAAFQYFDNVGYWLTFNGPRATCRLGYGEGVHAPGIAHDGIGDYSCAYVVLRAHAAAYHLYKSEFPHLTAKMSIAIDFDWSEPASNSTADVEAAERRNLFEFGLYAHPIYKGNWPDTVIARVADRSKNEFFPTSRLPYLTQYEVDYINGTFDFMGVNIFTAHYVADIAEPAYGDPGYMKDMKAEIVSSPAMRIKAITPWAARKTLVWLKDTYNSPEIFVTGNGVADSTNDESDAERALFYRNYLDAILDAMYEDGVNVFGYTAWSLLDSFEWDKGYSENYGFFQITDREYPLMRYPKYSFAIYSDIAKYHQIYPTLTTSTTTLSTTTGSARKTSVYPLFLLLSTSFYYLLL